MSLLLVLTLAKEIWQLETQLQEILDIILCSMIILKIQFL